MSEPEPTRPWREAAADLLAAVFGDFNTAQTAVEDALAAAYAEGADDFGSGNIVVEFDPEGWGDE